MDKSFVVHFLRYFANSSSLFLALRVMAAFNKWNCNDFQLPPKVENAISFDLTASTRPLQGLLWVTKLAIVYRGRSCNRPRTTVVGAIYLLMIKKERVSTVKLGCKQSILY
jgi:hypothetical protein